MTRCASARARGESLRDLVKQEIRRDLRRGGPPGAERSQPHVTLIVGVNGTGKTTTIGKLANLLKDEGKQPLDLRRRHVSCRRRRAARNVGQAGRRRHRAREGRVGSGRRRVRRDSVGQGARPRSDSGGHGRPPAHAREPDERARQDPARGGARGRGRAARGAARARRDRRSERTRSRRASSPTWRASPASC